MGLKPLTEEQKALAEQYVPLAHGIVTEALRRWGGGLPDRDTLLSEAFFSLCKSARSFNPNRGIKFGTYARHGVWQALSELCKRELSRKNGFRGKGYAKVRTVYDADSLLDKKAEDPAAVAERSETLDALGELIRGGFLVPIERTIIEHRLGLNGIGILTYQQLAIKTGLHKEKVRAIEDVARKRLRGALDKGEEGCSPRCEPTS